MLVGQTVGTEHVGFETMIMTLMRLICYMYFWD